MTKLSGTYQALGLVLLPDRAVTRFLYVRPHVSESDSLPDECTLFVAGLPVRLNEEALLEVFSVFGPVISAALHPEKTTALVVFGSPDSLQAAYAAASDRRILEVQLEEPTAPFGLKGWVKDHQAKFPGNDVLKKQLDGWMDQYEAAKKAKAAAAAAAEADGWTTVKRQKGRKKNTDESGIVVAGVAASAALTKSANAAQKKPHIGFYRFQQREKRVNELEELRRKFADDKRRVAELRAARNFKPE
ncbi:hypothetical protein WJX74_001431 [Apatococcus lobatus]|uniref:RRM domain-containing protein n=2 Tax=Apatococcus TaxID=904362 RepID=A0AAW1SUQ9_9CHLO